MMFSKSKINDPAPTDTAAAKPAHSAAPFAAAPAAKTVAVPEEIKPSYAEGHPSPAAAKIMAENKVVSEQISGSGKDGRILKSDVLEALSKGIEMPTQKGWSSSRETSRERMSMLRRKIAQRLVAVKNETAMLTTSTSSQKVLAKLTYREKDRQRLLQPWKISRVTCLAS